MERIKTDPDFPYTFNNKKAIRFINWIKLFKHTKGILAGKRIDPEPIQLFVFGNIYGWEHRETGKRRFKKSYWQVGRKNAKTQSLAAQTTYELMQFTEEVSECYVAALNKEQADILYTETSLILGKCEELNKLWEEKYSTIYYKKNRSTFTALSKESRKSGAGKNVQFAAIDEYYAHPTSEVYALMDTGTGARPEPLVSIITTAGFNLDYPCYQEYKMCKKILDPSDPTELDHYFVMINELDAGDDPFEEKNWIKANPIRATYQEGLNDIRQKAAEAKIAPEKLRDFLTLYCNVWVDLPEEGFLDYNIYEKSKIPQLPFPLREKEVYIGIDLSDKNDLSSVNYEFPILETNENGEEIEMWYWLSHSYIPYKTVDERERKEHKPYRLWANQGHITITDAFAGELIDYRKIIDDIIQFVNDNELTVRAVGVDPRGATMLMQELSQQGYNVFAIYQSHSSQADPLTHIREQMRVGGIKVVNNPTLDAAVKIAKIDSNSKGEIILNKNRNRASERIDPLSAAACSHKLAMGYIFNYKEQNFTESYFDNLWG